MTKSSQTVVTASLLKLVSVVTLCEAFARRSISDFLVGYFPDAPPGKIPFGVMKEIFSQEKMFSSSLNSLTRPVVRLERAISLGARLAKVMLDDPSLSQEGAVEYLSVLITEEKRTGVTFKITWGKKWGLDPIQTIR